MFIDYREIVKPSTERRWYRRTDGRYLPTWAMIILSRFARRNRSGNGVYLVEHNGFVMKVSDYQNGAYR